MVALTAQRCTSPSTSRKASRSRKRKCSWAKCLMTPSGSFVINGAERVIVSQLHRSPGLAFEASTHANGKTLHSYRIIPDRGSWFETQFDTNDLLYVYLDRKKRRRKFLITTFFRALCFLKDDGAKGTDREILEMFYDIEEMSLKKVEKHDNLADLVLTQDIEDGEKRDCGPRLRAAVARCAQANCLPAPPR